MPFTPAHVAIVLPFIRSHRLSATGLIIGSLSPDFEYFVRMSTRGTFSHTLAGLFYFDVPMVLVLSLIFHLVVKKNLIRNMPEFFQARFHDTLQFDFYRYLKKHFWIFLLSAFLGAASHLLWDSFTHKGGFFAQLLAYDEGVFYEFDGVDYPLYYSLQHMSTFIGLLILGMYILLKKPDNISYAYPPKLSYYISVILLSLFIFYLRYYFKSYDFNYGNKIVTSLSAGMLALIICGVIPFTKKAQGRLSN